MKLVVIVLLLGSALWTFRMAAGTDGRTSTSTVDNGTEISTVQLDAEESFAESGLLSFVRHYEKLRVHLSDSPYDGSDDDDDDDNDDEFDEEDEFDGDGDDEPQEGEGLDYLDNREDENRRQHSYFHLAALGERFKIRYSRTVPSIFAADATITVIEDDGRRRTVRVDEATSGYIEGRLVGNRHSQVYGDLSAGFFDGVIATADETYFFEAADKYFRRPRFNAVAYRASDVTMCPRHGASSVLACSLEREPMTSRSRMVRRSTTVAYVDDGNDDVMPEEVESKGSVSGRRGAAAAAYNRKQCRTMIVVDHTFMTAVARGSDRKAINEVTVHMKATDRIFTSTDFDGDGRPDGIGFKLASVELFRRTTGYPLEGVFSDPDTFLLKVAHFDLSDYCAGFAFTFRNMRGVLGASYLGVAEKGVDGGICAPRKVYPMFGNLMVNLNSGFASFKYADHDKMVPRGRSICTVAHEFGHLFGSPHDDAADVDADPRCNPTRSEEKYLMATKRAVDARITARNQRFSVCSRMSIRKFLHLKGHCLV